MCPLTRGDCVQTTTEPTSATTWFELPQGALFARSANFEEELSKCEQEAQEDEKIKVNRTIISDRYKNIISSVYQTARMLQCDVWDLKLGLISVKNDFSLINYLQYFVFDAFKPI